MKEHKKYAVLGLRALRRASAKVAENARKNNYRIPIWKNGRIEYEIPEISTIYVVAFGPNMLRELSIKNFTIIDNLHISFSDGLTILSGETGAGKSIIINAVNLLLGSKATSQNHERERF
jgi:ABC-type multidrug transport system ATPase subunit